MCSMSTKRAMYSEEVGADDQAAFAARGVEPDAGDESLGVGEAGHQDEAASDGAFFCQRERGMVLIGRGGGDSGGWRFRNT